MVYDYHTFLGFRVLGLGLQVQNLNNSSKSINSKVLYDYRTVARQGGGA